MHAKKYVFYFRMQSNSKLKPKVLKEQDNEKRVSKSVSRIQTKTNRQESNQISKQKLATIQRELNMKNKVEP